MGWSDLIGRQLNQYTIVGELGRGGSSRVYRGFDTELQREVAIKVIPNDAEDRVGFIRRFEREVQAVAKLDHPNIVAVFDRGETDDLVYLVMQCVTGGTLRQRCGRPLPIAEATAAVVQMCYALHHAHQHGIIHRDVKPSNMLVDADNPHYLLLTDFGIAKLQGMRGLTKSGTTIGTPEYMSPEQAEGKDIDQRADVYSLGCVLYETLAGRPPFIGSTSVSVLYQQVHSRPSYLRAFNSEVPREMARIVEQALAKRPEDRFGTAAQLGEALYPYAEGMLPPLPGLDSRAPGATASGPLVREIITSGPLTPASFASVSPITPISSILPGTSSGTTGPLNRMDTAQPALPGSGELVAPERWHGLGAEGLDAIFPDDPEAQTSHEARTDAIANTPTIQELPPVAPVVPAPPQETSTRLRDSNRSIPLPAFRLPSKVTQPLDLPLTPNGRLDMEALMTQVEAQYGQPPATKLAESLAATQREEAPAATLQELPSEAVEDRDTGELEALAQPVTPREMALRAAASVASGPRPVWRPSLDDERANDEVKRADGRSVRRPNLPNLPNLPNMAHLPNRRFLLPGVAITAVLLISLAVWIGVSASGLALVSHNQRTPVTQKATATATIQPSPTATVQRKPTASPTLTPQQVLNNEAAASFRSVTVSQFADQSCSPGNQTTHFGAGQTVYVNLCSSSNPLGDPITVTIQQGGAVIYTLRQNLYLPPSSGYTYYRYGIPNGAYDMVVTMQINGQVAVARDIAFTIG